MVADKTVAKLEVCRKVHCGLSDTDDEVSDAALAQWWLDFGVSRKITKRNCMTFPHR